MFHILNADPRRLIFELSDVHTSFANGIRRCCLVEVPTVAIDPTSISFSSDDEGINTTSVHDEYIAHRIAEMPVNIDPAHSDKYQFRICDPKDPSKPWHNTSDAIVNFTSSDIEVLYDKKKVDNSRPFLNDILLLRLKPDQKLKTTFSAVYRSVRQTGNISSETSTDRHMRWSPCLVKYKFKTPKKSTQTTEDEFKYLGHEKKEPQTFIMEIKTFGTVLTAENIVRQAIQILGNKCRRLLKGIDEHDNSVVEEYSDPDLPNMQIVLVRNEDHTLGNIIVNAVMDIQKDNAESFVAYSKTHPLDNDLVIKMRSQKDTSVLNVMSEALQHLEKNISEAITNWQHVCRIFKKIG